jgi:hypothetical protein
MIINVSKKRKEFEKIIRKLGYRDRSPILTNDIEESYPILEELSGHSFQIFYFTIPYFNKKTYVYRFFIENYSEYSKKDMLKQLKILTKDIIYKEKTKMIEVGWGITNDDRILYSTKNHLKNIYIGVIKFAKIVIKMGNSNLSPNEGDILISKPDGGKLLARDTPDNIKKGTEQRGNINTKLGFGPIKEQKTQYGRYDENLILRPI